MGVLPPPEATALRKGLHTGFSRSAEEEVWKANHTHQRGNVFGTRRRARKSKKVYHATFKNVQHGTSDTICDSEGNGRHNTQ